MSLTWMVPVTEEQRTRWAQVLGEMVTAFTNAKPQIENLPSPALPQAQRPAAAATVDSVQPRDRWARDRKGNELPNPEGCYSVTVHIFKTERADIDNQPRMKISFDSPTGRGSVNAGCWDEKLFPFLAVAAKAPSALLHIVKKGKYLNVVGIRA